MIQKKIQLIFIVLLISVLSANAQRALKYEDYDSDFKTGIDLFNKEKYGNAQFFFERIAKKYGSFSSDVKADANYLAALCAIELFNKDAEYLLINFIDDNPESSSIKNAYYQMGKYQYRKKKYNRAIEWFEKIDKYTLSNDELAEYYFKIGYSYFVMKNYSEAGKAFYEIKDVDTKYTVSALYYYSHISYINKNYENALIGFEKLSKNVSFAPIVPYYITQIYYYQEKYDKVIEYAPSILDSAMAKRQPEIARIIGESYYRTNKFKDAIKYLEFYREKSSSFSRDDNYELGYAYFRTSEFEKAIDFLKKAVSDNDLISQNSYYHLAYCYIKNSDKNSARLSFGNASKMDYDKAVKEDALYNYAKLTYELSFSPFNEAIKSFNKYIELYPNSERLDEIYSYLAKVYMTTKNYKDAIESFENIQKVTDETEAAYQKVTFYRALELFNDLKFTDAIINFDKSLNNSRYNASYKAQSLYWRGEAYYRIKRYDDALGSLNQYILSAGAINMDEYQIAHYNMAYCYFKKKDYQNAIVWYRKYTAGMPDVKSKMTGDANIRIADCYFISKDYQKSLEFYNNAIEIKTTDVDYAMFQKGFSLGLLKEYNDKIVVLNNLLNDYPKSAFCDDALYELGRSFVAISDDNQAITTYQKIIAEYPSSSYVNKALLQMAMIYYNTDKNDEALATYKKVVEKSPGTSEATDALFGIKNVYVEKNDVDSYIEYTKTLGDFANVSLTEQDSLTYLSAEKLYMTGDCQQSPEKFNAYIDKFPTGSFILNANYYKADCNYRNNELQSALKSYDYVIKQSKNKFTENALLNCARINFELANYSEALNQYTELEKVSELRANQMEARIGKMKSAYNSSAFIEAIKYAVNVLTTEKLDDETFRQAHYILAKSYFIQNELETAFDEFKILSHDCKSKEGAEAKYYVSEIYYSKKELDKAEKEIFDFVEKNTPFQYWLGKAFILLGDIYVARKDNFQAKQTYQSIIDNYSAKNDSIIEIAEQKLEVIVENEKAEQQLKDALQIQIKFEDNEDGQYDKLFIEDDEIKSLEMPPVNNDSIK